MQPAVLLEDLAEQALTFGLFKAEGLPNLDTPATGQRMRLRDNPLACDRPEVHEVYRRWRALAEAYSPPRVLIGEVDLPQTSP